MSRFTTLMFIISLSGCAVAAPTSPGGISASVGGKADGLTPCDEGEIAFIQCIDANCADDESDECVDAACADVMVDVSLTCADCVEANFGDLEVAAVQCATTPTPAGPCAEETALVECAATNCDGLGGDPLIECIDESCEEESADTSPLCAECILVRGQGSVDGLRSCAVDAPAEQCGTEEAETITTCAADNCGELEGEEHSTCLATTCEDELRALDPVCLHCVGTGLDRGAALDETIASCRGGDAPAPEGPRVCTADEMADVLTCGDASCADLTGDALNECLEASCAETLESAELSEECGACFVWTAEGGADLAGIRAQCVGE